MSYKIRLPDDRYLEIGLRESVDDESTKVIPIEDLEPERSDEREEESSGGGGRRVGRFLALGGIALGTLLVARSLRRRRSRDSPRVEITEEEDVKTTESRR